MSSNEVRQIWYVVWKIAIGILSEVFAAQPLYLSNRITGIYTYWHLILQLRVWYVKNTCIKFTYRLEHVSISNKISSWRRIKISVGTSAVFADHIQNYKQYERLKIIWTYERHFVRYRPNAPRIAMIIFWHDKLHCQKWCPIAKYPDKDTCEHWDCWFIWQCICHQRYFHQWLKPSCW